MSAFRRKVPGQAPPPPGTRQCSSAPSVLQLSTGVPSLDDILGGGIPLGCLLLVLTPDPHSAWGDLLQKYFVAQGLVGGQGVTVVANGAVEFVEGCMWLPAGESVEGLGTPSYHEHEGSGDSTSAALNFGEKVTIAWRYKQMKQFQTTISAACKLFLAFPYV